MSTNIILAIVIISELLIGSYYIGRYVSSANEIFDNNSYASWTLGIVTNLFLTFIVFFVFSWIEPPIIYYVIIFFIKEFLVYTFLILRRDRIKGNVDFRNIAIVLIAAIAITFIYNYGINKYTNDSIITKGDKFSTWFQFKEVLGHFSTVPADIINEWTVSFVVAAFAFTTVAAFLREISKGNVKHVPYLAFLLVLAILSFVGTGVRLEDSLGYFLLLFMLISAIRLVIYSRRRYAAEFGMTSFVAWTIDSKVFLAATALALVTTIIYTYLKKPKSSLFWVQLVSPQVMIMTLQLHWISIGVVIPLFILSAGLYIFMLSARRVKFLSRLNEWVIKYRTLIPVIMLLILCIASGIVIGTKEITLPWMDMKTTSSLIYNNTDLSKPSGIIQMVIWTLATIYMIWRIVKMFTSRRNIQWVDFIMLISTLLTVFVYNPFIERMFESAVYLAPQMTALGIITVVPIIAVLLNGTSQKLVKYVETK